MGVIKQSRGGRGLDEDDERLCLALARGGVERETGRGDCSCSTWLHKVSLPGGVEPGPVTLPMGFGEREEPGNGYSGGYMGDIG